MVSPQLMRVVVGFSLLLAGCKGDSSEKDGGPNNPAGEDSGTPETDTTPSEPSTNESVTTYVPSASDALCDEEWCWERPVPQGRSITGIWASAKSDRWFVTAGGAILHHDGTQWRLDHTEPGATWRGIWGKSSDDLWAIGRTGDSPLVMRRRDGEWSRAANGVFDERISELSGIWGSGDGPMYVSANGFWDAEWHGEIYALEAGAWRLDFAVDDTTFDDLHGTAADNVWLASVEKPRTFDGEGWQLRGLPNFAEAIWANSPDDVWAGGTHEIYRHDGSIWDTFPLDSPAEVEDLFAVGEFAVAAVTGPGREGLYVYEDGEFRGAGLGTWSMLSLAGGHGEVLAGGYGGSVYRLSEEAWVPMAEDVANLHEGDYGLVSDTFFSAFVANEVVVAVGSDGLVARFEGGEWLKQESGVTATLLDVDGTGPDDIWAVGRGGAITHWDGSTWTPVESGTIENLNGVGVLGSEVWAAGNSATLIRKDGAGFEPVDVSVNYHFHDAERIDGALWFVGVNGAIYRFDGTDLDRLFDDADLDDIMAVHGTAGDDVWFIDDKGALGRYRGNGDWDRMATLSVVSPTDIFVDATGPWVAGKSGLHRSDGTLSTPLAEPTVIRQRGSELLVFGTDGGIVRSR